MNEPKSLKELFEEYVAANKDRKIVGTWAWSHVHRNGGYIINSSDTFDDRAECVSDAKQRAECQDINLAECVHNHETLIERLT